MSWLSKIFGSSKKRCYCKHRRKHHMKRRRRHNTRRYMHYSPKLSKRLVRAAKIRYRKARLQWLRHAKKHYPGMIRARSHNRRPVKTPYKWFVKYYGVKEGAKYYREAQRKHK